MLERHGRSLEGHDDAPSALAWPKRAGKLVLGLALDRLAEHDRLP